MATKKYIVLHHSATSDGVVQDFDALLRGHLVRGYRDIGYHWVVERINGQLTCLPGRAEWDDAAACPGKNQDGIHICCVGNFQEVAPSEELYKFVADLCRQIMSRHPIQKIGGHRDYYVTVCPGKYFDAEKVIQLVEGGRTMKEPTAKVAIDWLCSQGIITSPDYWTNAVGCVKYLDSLLIGIMKKFRVS